MLFVILILTFMNETYFLAVETSCDDTSVSVLRAKEDGKGRLKKIEALSNVVSSQTELHAGYGGVYPFLAKREHQKNLPVVFEQAIKKIDVAKIKFIGVTKGPGLDPCLWTGINFAQKLAKKYNLPLAGVNHLEAHFLANLLTLGIGEDEFAKNYLPAICLVVSGGHTLLFLATGIGDYKLLGQTVDDAAGECFDKAARILGLGYPGGPEIAKYAAYHSVEVKPPLNLLKRRFSGGLTSTTSTTSEPLLVFFTELLVGFEDCLPEIVGHGGVIDDGPDFLPLFAEVVHVMGIKIGENALDFLTDPGGFQEVAVCFGGHGKAVRNVDAFHRKFPPHLTEGCVFASDLGDVLQPYLFEPDYKLLGFHGIPPHKEH